MPSPQKGRCWADPLAIRQQVTWVVLHQRRRPSPESKKCQQRPFDLPSRHGDLHARRCGSDSTGLEGLLAAARGDRVLTALRPADGRSVGECAPGRRTGHSSLTSRDDSQVAVSSSTTRFARQTGGGGSPPNLRRTPSPALAEVRRPATIQSTPRTGKTQACRREVLLRIVSRGVQRLDAAPNPRRSAPCLSCCQAGALQILRCSRRERAFTGRGPGRVIAVAAMHDQVGERRRPGLRRS